MLTLYLISVTLVSLFFGCKVKDENTDLETNIDKHFKK